VTKPLRTTRADEGEQFSAKSSSATVVSIEGILRRQRRRFFYNRAADVVVRLGGIAVLFSISAIFLVILAESLPLFFPVRSSEKPLLRFFSPSPTVFAGYSAAEDRPFLLSAAGVLQYFTAGEPEHKPLEVVLPLPEGSSVESAASLGRSNKLAVGTSDGRLVRIDLPPSDPGPDAPILAPAVTDLDPQFHRPVTQLAAEESEGKLSVAALLKSEGDGKPGVSVYSARRSKSLVGEGKLRETSSSLPLADETVTAIELGINGDILFAGTAGGVIEVFDVRKADQPALLTKSAVEGAGPDSITALKILLGDQRLIVGRASGAVESWMFAGGTPFSGAPLRRVNSFATQGAGIREIAASARTRQFVTLSESGVIGVHYGTSGTTDLSLPSAVKEPLALGFAPKGDEFFALTKNGEVKSWTLSNPYPEISLRSLFGKVWYEGYAQPEFVWQSSSGSDAFEPKLSLVPLIFGTLKGTFYSLLFAVPIALLGALYTASFMSGRQKAVIKPVVELMAALPSVVIGFIAGLWLAPRLGLLIPGLVLFPFILFAGVCGAFMLSARLPRELRAKFPQGAESILLLPVVLVVIILSFGTGLLAEHLLMGGNYSAWLNSAFGIDYDQRNSLVVGLAMGFAVIPLIFTIAEDSLSSVPSHLSAGSLALGASRWQTAIRVVIPAASPGIFSAIMLGFGRAVGETMIVLMATGNTPVMDLSPFNGFRAMSANIAVELPEAARGTTLYRILFFASLLLFLTTFVVNTLTEIVRQKLRRRYGQV